MASSGKTAGMLVLALIVIIAIVAIVVITTKSQCKVPSVDSDNPCPISEVTGDQTYPYCAADGKSSYQCLLGDKVCGDLTGVCPSGQHATTCNWETQAWTCESDNPDPPSGGTLCTVSDDGKLNNPIAYDNKLYPSMVKPLKHYSSYREIVVSDAKGCELASCNTNYTVSDNKSFCVSKDKGVCDDKKNGQFDSNAYSVYPDPNATWTKAYKFPDGDTSYCKFDTCIDGYSFDAGSKKCVLGGGDKGKCGERPEHADQTTSQCGSDGKWYITKCNPDNTYIYKPSTNNQKCDKSTCVTTCGRMESDCILNPTNESDIFCSAYGSSEAMGVNKSEILGNAATNQNMYIDSSDGSIIAMKRSVKNPWGGCGSDVYPGFMTDPKSQKCIVPSEYVRFKYKAWPGDSDYRAGCTECPTLLCNGPPQPDYKNCLNYKEGCENVEEKGGNWDSMCKSDHPPPTNMSYGAVESDYMPLVWTTITIQPPWADWDIDGLTIRSFDKDCNQKYVSGNISEEHASEKVEVPIQVGGYVVFSAMHYYAKGFTPKKRYDHVAYKYDTLISLLPKGKQVEAAEYVFTTGCKDKRVYVKGLSNTGDKTPPKCIPVV